MASEAKFLREQMKQQHRFLATMNEGQFNLLYSEIGREVEHLDSKRKMLKTELWGKREPNLHYTFGENVCAIAEEKVESVAPKNEQEERIDVQNERIDMFSDVEPEEVDVRKMKMKGYHLDNEENSTMSAAAASRISLPSHVKSITSTSNPFVKHCLELRQSSSYRHAHGSVLVVGAIPIREVCMFQENKQGITTEIECLLLHEEAQIPQGLESQSIRIVRVSSLVMKKLSGVQSTESVEAIALMRIPSSFVDLKDDENVIRDCNKWFPSAHRVLVLDSIQDPGNLGTLIRSAMAFNWDGAFLLPGCCDPFNDKALRASRGASFQLPIVSGNWNHLKLLENEFHMKLLAGHPETTTTQKLKPVPRLSQEFAQSLAEKPLCVILGSEGNGLSEQSRKVCELVSIPMAGEFESLNVSVAGGIFLFMFQSCSGF